MTLSDTHALGIARHHMSLGGETSDTLMARVLDQIDREGVIRTGKGVRRVIDAIARHLKPIAWRQQVVSDRHLTVASWLTYSRDQGEFVIGQFKLWAMRDVHRVLPIWRPMLRIPLHAIARSHQRVGAVEWAAIFDEIGNAALLAAPVAKAAQQHGLKQFGLPSFNGMLIGHIDGDQLHAATFIIPPFAQRWGALLDAWVAFHAQLTPGEKMALVALSLNLPHGQAQTVVERLGSVLTAPGLGHLREEYSPGRDISGEIWDAALAQHRKVLATV